MPSILKELKLTELSLVDRPANPEAYAPIFKSDSKKGESNQMEDTIKMSDDMKAKLKPYMDKGMSAEEAMKAYEEDMKAENERLRKALIENEFVIKADSIEKKAPVEFIEVEGEQINKADIPAPILKRLEEAEIEKAEAALEKKADEVLPHFDKDAAKALLKFDLDDKVIEALMAADAAFEAVMSEKGDKQVDADMNTAEAKLDEMVKAYKAENSTTLEKAYAEVTKTKEGKALVSEIYKAKKED